MKAYFVSLGCPKNTVDMEAALSILAREGHVPTDDPFSADILLVNSCSFLESAWSETMEEIERLSEVKKKTEGKKLILMGCLPEHREQDLGKLLPSVDFFLSPGKHALLPSVILFLKSGRRGEVPDVKRPVDVFAGFESRGLLTPGHTAYVKIAEGCSHTCSFCTIPKIKGPMVSRSPGSIEREVLMMVRRGVKEITLIAQDTASYESDGYRLPDLVELLSQTGIKWIRILYVHPSSLRIDDLMRIFEVPQVCRYLDIPVQHISDHILSEMKRSYRAEYIEKLILEIRNAFPDMVLRSEIITGFPGETEKDFELLKEFLSSGPFENLGIFPYSRERGTEAYALGDAVPPALKAHRYAELNSLREGIAFSFNSSFLGKTLDILVDREIADADEISFGCKFAGRYYGQAYEIDGEVLLEGENIRVGNFVSARITDANVFDLMAEVVYD